MMGHLRSFPFFAETWLMLVLGGVILTSRYNYLLFHSLAEFFSIVIAWSFFVLAWNTRRYVKDDTLLILGIAALFVGGIDLLHTLAYRGMNIFIGYDANLPTQLWIAARYLQSISLLLVALRMALPSQIDKPVNASIILAAYSTVTMLLLWAIFERVFPTCYIEGMGLTPFKKTSEFVISSILLVSILLLWRERERFDRSVLNMLLSSIVMMIAAEFAFTFYVGVYDFSNLLGHVAKIVAFYLLYRAVILTGLERPHALLFRELKESEELFRAFMKYLPGVAFMKDASGRYVFINDRFDQIFEASSEDWKGKTDQELAFFPEDVVEQLVTNDRLVLAERRPLETIQSVPVGDETRHWLTVKFPLTGWGSTSVLLAGISIDITNQMRAEAMLRENEKKLRKSEIFLNATGQMAKVGGWEVDAETHEVLWTEQTYHIFEVAPGYEPSLEETIQFFHPEDRSKLARAIQRSLDHGEPYDMEVRCITAGGRDLWVRSICEPQIADGKTVTLKGIFGDITERKHIEEDRIRLERQVQQMQKAESLGRMAGAIAHHFNNLLGVVMGNLELAVIDLPQGSKPRANIAQAMKASGRAAEISRLMLAYLGMSIGERAPIELSEVGREALPMLIASLPEKVHLEMEFPDDEPIIRADAVQIRQILTNLVVNAGEAIGEREGSVIVAVHVIPAADIRASRFYPPEWEPKEENYACLSVSDTGIGMDQDTLEKIFDPFFSTKFLGRGLGLPVVLGIVKAHEGALTVESAPGRGTVFRVFMPLLAQKLPLPQMAKPIDTTLPKERGLVLLVDDEPMLRKMARIMLERLGYEAITAADGVEALEVFRARQDYVQCVLLDLTMPLMDGWETLAVLRALRPDLPVILVSGYDETNVMQGHHPERPQAFLHKPYRMKGLEAALEKALKTPPGASKGTL
jgi:PAS domain S-box-containing protein